ncbi:hypothetical protein GW17_00062470 [Ensete ventricosum]|nr:hypothetical protein GW17_00062470 [Ensete ventricosum]
MEGPSSAAEVVNLGPQVVGHPSGSPGVEVMSSSLGEATPDGFQDMVNLMKVKKKSADHAPSRLAPPPPAEVLAMTTGEHPMQRSKKCPSGRGSKPPKKKTKVTISKRTVKAKSW